jgi:hypothetical protein
MHFDTKSYLKSIQNHTTKHALREDHRKMQVHGVRDSFN